MSRPIVVTRRMDGAVVATVSGELDIATAPELRAGLTSALRVAVERDEGEVIVDLSAVTFMDACGLSALMACRRQAGERGQALLLAGVPARVRYLLRIANLEQAFRILPSLAVVPASHRRHTGGR